MTPMNFNPKMENEVQKTEESKLETYKKGPSSLFEKG